MTVKQTVRARSTSEVKRCSMTWLSLRHLFFFIDYPFQSLLNNFFVLAVSNSFISLACADGYRVGFNLQ